MIHTKIQKTTSLILRLIFSLRQYFSLQVLAVANVYRNVLDGLNHGPFLFIFMQFSGNFGRINVVAPSHQEILDPPLVSVESVGSKTTVITILLL